MRASARKSSSKHVRVVKGGRFAAGFGRAQALKHIPDDTEFVVVHDAVRPFVTVEQITRVIEEARRCQAAILAFPRWTR